MLSFKLPCKAFKCCTTEELKYLEKHLLEIPNNNDIGYILKISLDYRKKLHDKHNDYPFFPIHKEIKNEDLFPYQNKLRKITKSRKLVTSLENKKGLICDYRTLKQAIQHGLKLNGIECAIKYEQR